MVWCTLVVHIQKSVQTKPCQVCCQAAKSWDRQRSTEVTRRVYKAQLSGQGTYQTPAVDEVESPLPADERHLTNIMKVKVESPRLVVCTSYPVHYTLVPASHPTAGRLMPGIVVVFDGAARPTKVLSKRLTR